MFKPIYLFRKSGTTFHLQRRGNSHNSINTRYIKYVDSLKNFFFLSSFSFRDSLLIFISLLHSFVFYRFLQKRFLSTTLYFTYDSFTFSLVWSLFLRTPFSLLFHITESDSLCQSVLFFSRPQA